MNKTTTEISDVAYRPDSVELGTPGKGYCVKVYFDAAKMDEAKKLVNDAIEIAEFAHQRKEHPPVKAPEVSTTAAPPV